MRIAIVYDSSTGKTKAAAEKMGDTARAAGHDCTVESIQDADPVKVAAADALCIGCWTKGLFIIMQAPTDGIMEFISRLGPLEGKPAAAFTTYDIAVGRMLHKMAAALEARGAQVTGRFKAKGPNQAAGFGAWVEKLETSV